MCDQNIDECAAINLPCLNGGNCSDCVPSIGDPAAQPVGGDHPCHLGYMCSCAHGYFGDNCETEVDFCMSSPCRNNGSCHDVVGGPGYSCVCLQGYTGQDCEEDLDECSVGAGPCQNGGICNVSL